MSYGRDVLYAVVTSNQTPRMHTINVTWAPTVSHIRFYSNEGHKLDSRVVVAAPHATTRQQVVDLRYSIALKHATHTATILRLPWIMMLDDDTFVYPRNVDRLLKRSAPSSTFLGQQCPALHGFRSFCGGAGWIARTSLCRRLVKALPTCKRKYAREADYDRVFGLCLFRHMNVTPTWVPQLNSQSPVFYETALGKSDRPTGYERAATFHYVPTFYAEAHQHYVALWKAANLGPHRS